MAVVVSWVASWFGRDGEGSGGGGSGGGSVKGGVRWQVMMVGDGEEEEGGQEDHWCISYSSISLSHNDVYIPQQYVQYLSVFEVFFLSASPHRGAVPGKYYCSSSASATVATGILSQNLDFSMGNLLTICFPY